MLKPKLNEIKCFFASNKKNKKLKPQPVINTSDYDEGSLATSFEIFRLFRSFEAFTVFVIFVTQTDLTERENPKNAILCLAVGLIKKAKLSIIFKYDEFIFEIRTK